MPLRWSLVLGLVLAAVTGASLAQPPGTPPPDQVFDADETEEDDKLPLGAFMFLSESDNPVMMPGLTWEEFERLLNLDNGMEGARQPFSYQSLEITGSAQQQRAELEIAMRLSIEPTGDRFTSIPLGMSNFHRLAPPDVSGVDEHFMALSPDKDAGYLLFVRTRQASEVLLRMRVSARLGELSGARTLPFHLPDVPTRVALQTEARKVTGEVIGRGDETILHETTDSGQTQLIVESGGGDFSLRWGQGNQMTENLPLLEVESRFDVRWDSPQDQPIATVRMTVKNIRGAISSFQLRLPTGSVVLDQPRLGASGQTIDLGEARSEGEIREVLIPEEERLPRIDLNFELQWANDNATASSPLSFRIPEIVGALRHRGEIEIQTGGDYRLRWRARPWVRGTLGETAEEGTTGRSYTFLFDRGSFELPLWLGEKERQLRLVSQSQITVREAMASLEMTIQVNGQTSDGRLQFDDASWQITSIESTATGEPLESFMAEPYRVIEFDPATSDEPAPIRIRAERTIDGEDPEIRLGIPRVVEVEDTVVVQSATVNIVNSGRTLLVVDLEASSGLTRVVPSNAEINADSPITRLRVLSQEEPAEVVGKLVDQLPRITLSSESNVELDGRQLHTMVDWEVSSALDLEGALPIRIPAPQPTTRGTDRTDEELDAAGVSSTAASSSSQNKGAKQVAEDWLVTVDNVRAELRPEGDDRYTLISPRLRSGSMSIRWHQTRLLRSQAKDGALESVALPRPDFPDVTVRGTQLVTLTGNQQFELTTAEAPTLASLALEALPRDPIRLRLSSRLTTREELSIRQTILRTAVGRSTRHEQVLAEIQGGEEFQVGLPENTAEISVEALVDNVSTPVRREDDTLSIVLPGDQATHVIDLRVWVSSETPASFVRVEPLLKLPVGVGRVFWQIITPLDGHIIWAAPTLGRSMTWRFDRWRLYREPTYDDRGLNSLVASSLETVPANNTLPPGNRYLYVGSDIRSFEVIVVSRVVLWIVIGSMVLVTAISLTRFPQLRHPLTAVGAAVVFGGLLAIAPDAAVLAGQFGIIALVLVIVMVAVRVLVSPRGGDRVFNSTIHSPGESSASTRSARARESDSAGAVPTTQTVAPPATSEASS